ncbi:alanine racemase [Rhizobium grahamii]|uniref:Alanine racemase n=1 Tax=Rhizobium grahamii CCGE 502 TaxID=990285 RepID=S3HE84_9HYPH|nr:alanine racemase [Rhizobium grahamii]EPE97039.1 alanine racemase [Rhizobium grahamii CCGE 502]
MRPRTRLSVDLSAIEYNFQAVRRLVGKKVGVSAVVKSDAYGLGLDPIVSSLASVGCQSFFVADVREAVRIRRRLPEPEIFVLDGFRPSRKMQYRSDRLVPVCNTLSEARAVSSTGVSYAINLETGLSRLGLNQPDTCRFMHLNQPCPVLVMSHLACADDLRHPLNRLQRDRFIGMAGLLGDVRRSLVASSGLGLGEAYHFDQVRIGSAIFGIGGANFNPNPFLPVVRLRARIVDTRLFPAGATIGYMATFRTQRPSWIAVIAAGYAHGLPWSLANRMSVEIGSHRAPVVGRVSMEYAAVDVTGIPAAVRRQGLWVELVSTSQPVENLAGAAATIPQEILTRLGRSSQRNYRTNSPGEQT